MRRERPDSREPGISGMYGPAGMAGARTADNTNKVRDFSGSTRPCCDFRNFVYDFRGGVRDVRKSVSF